LTQDEALSRTASTDACLPCRDGSARQGRTPGASAAGAAVQSAVADLIIGGLLVTEVDDHDDEPRDFR
jgi:hypothetical protein